MLSRLLAFVGLRWRRGTRGGGDAAAESSGRDAGTDKTVFSPAPDADETRLACDAGPASRPPLEPRARERLAWPARDLSRSHLVGSVSAEDAMVILDRRASPETAEPSNDATRLVPRQGRPRPFGS